MSSPSLQLARPRRTLPGFVVALMTLTPAVGIEAGENGRRLELTVRDSFLPRFPVLVRVELRTADGSLCREVWDAEVELVVTGEDVTVEPRTPSIRLRNGVGSVLLELDAATDITLHAELGDLGATRTLRLLESDHEVATGTLPAGVTQWSGVVHVPEDLLVPEAATLRILPGTLVLMGSVESGSDGADINIVGRLESLGTAERPVTLTAAGPDGVDTPEEGYEWGELHHDDSVEESIYRYTIITLAGNSPRGGHTNTGPAVRPDGSRVVFESCSITDTVGKTMQANDSDLVIRDTLFARAVMGPEIEETQLLCERSYILEMFGDDDNDGIYLHDQRAGQEIRLTDCVVAAGDDDAIDTLGSAVTIEGCIVRDFADKGISVFHETALISRCQIVDNDIGISCKTSDDREATVTVEHCTIIGNRIGIEARNKGGDDPDALIHYRVKDSIIRRTESESAHTVRTDYEHSFIEINYTNLTPLPEDWAGVGNVGNIFDAPMFRDIGARDVHLRSESPCIDAADPDGDPDPDGSRADMGVFPFVDERLTVFRRGDANGDGARGVADAVTVLLFLFDGREIGCQDAADADDSGENEVTDAVFLLAYLFAGGAAPPAPLATCGVDMSEDDITCDTNPGCG